MTTIGRLGGFRLGRRLSGIWGWAVNRRQRRPRRTHHHQSIAGRLLAWARKFRGSGGSDRRRVRDRIRGDAVEEPLMGGEDGTKPPPKGHLAVYVGGPPQRYVVPVIYFNHPLFVELLKEAEAEFGFNHPGGITIPCPLSRFERVRTRIASSARFDR